MPLQAGDLLLFRGTDLVSRAIEIGTGKRYSHAALYCPIIVGDKVERHCVIEAIHTGVRLYPLKRYLHECDRLGTQVDWFKRTDKIDGERMVSWASSQLGRSYVRLWELAVNFLFRADVSENHRWFCSELVAEAANKSLEFPIPEPEKISPGDLANMPQLFEYQEQLKGDDL